MNCLKLTTVSPISAIVCLSLLLAIACNKNSVNDQLDPVGEWKQIGELSSISAWGLKGLQIDKFGQITLLHRDNYNPGKLTIIYHNEFGWQALGDEGFTEPNLKRIQIVFDSDNTPYIATRVNSQAEVWKLEDSTWVNIGNLGNADEYSLPFSITPTGQLFLARVQNNSVFVHKYETGNWSDVGDTVFTIIPDGFRPHVDLDTDDQGSVYVLGIDVRDNYKTTVKKYINDEWEIVGTAGISNISGFGDSYFLSLDVVTQNEIYVAIKGSIIDDYKTEILHYNGSTWSTMGEPDCYRSSTNRIKVQHSLLGTYVSSEYYLHQLIDEVWHQIDTPGGSARFTVNETTGEPCLAYLLGDSATVFLHTNEEHFRIKFY